MAPFPLITDLVINSTVFCEVWHSSLRIIYFLCPLNINRGKVQCKKKMKFYVAATRSGLKNFLWQDCALWVLSLLVSSFFLSSLPYFLLTKKMTRRKPLFGKRGDEADKNHDFHTHHCLHVQHVWWRLRLPIPEHEYFRYYSVNRQEWHKTRRPVKAYSAPKTFQRWGWLAPFIVDFCGT
jgi:hypothetical protein